MNPLLTGIITGGASLLGSIFSNEQSGENVQNQIIAQQGMQKEAESFNAEQAQISRDYNTQMSNTAYQRAASDMKAAGLNPMMMTGGAMNASTPPSPTPQISAQQVPLSQQRGAFAGIGDAVARGLDAAISAKTIDRMTSEIAANNARTENIDQDTLRGKLDRARQEWEAMHYLDLSNIPDKARIAGNIAEWGAGKVGAVGNAVGTLAGGVRGAMSLRGEQQAPQRLYVNPPRKEYSGLGPSGRQAVKDEVAQQMQSSAKQSETFKEWNKKIDAVREQFERDNPGFYGEGR